MHIPIFAHIAVGGGLVSDCGNNIQISQSDLQIIQFINYYTHELKYVIDSQSTQTEYASSS